MKKRDIDLKTSSEASREARFLFSIVAFFLLFRSVRAGKPGFRPGKSGLSGLRNGVSGRFPDSESPLAIPETALPTAKTGLSPSQKATPKTTVPILPVLVLWVHRATPWWLSMRPMRP